MAAKITFVIFTFNEEKRIERVIKNLKSYGNILLADNNSTDRTLEIAHAHGCDILLRKNQYVFVENQEMVDLIYSNITTDWIYWGFADEMITKDTLLQIQQATLSGNYDIISMDRKNYFYGSFCYDIYNAYTYKLFRRGAIDFRDNVIHSMGKATVSENRIYKMPDKYFVHHFISNTASSYLNVINRYTDAELEFGYKPKTSLLKLGLMFVKHIVKGRFMKGNHKAGYPGLALIELTLFYEVIKNMKLYEKDNNLTTPTIEDRNNVLRDKILADL